MGGAQSFLFLGGLVWVLWGGGVVCGGGEFQSLAVIP